MCAAKMLSARGKNIWVVALVQMILCVAFMSIFKFPKVMIVGFAGFILMATLLSAWMRSRPIAARPAPLVSSAHPIAFRVLSVFVGLGALVVISTLIFGSVIFLNNWDLWQKYKGQPYHRTDFIVTRTYFQKLGKGGVDVYASGTVDGNKEWMSLQPFLGKVRAHDEGELDDLVPEGTSIPIYLFPGMKGRMRIRVYGETPSAEGYYRAAISDLNTSLFILAITIAALFVLIRIRRAISDDVSDAPQTVAALQ